MSSPFHWPTKPSPRDGPHGGAPEAQPHAPDSLPPQTVVGSSCTPLSKKKGGNARASFAQCDAVLCHIPVSVSTQPQIRGLHNRRGQAAQRPRAADLRPSARRMGPLDGSLSCSALQLHPAAAAGLTTTALQSAQNRPQKCLVTLLSSLHPIVCGKIFTGLSCASKVTSVGSMPLVSWLGSFRAGRYGGAGCLRVKVLNLYHFVSPCITM